MIRRIAVTVRFPGARTAPVSRTFTCCHTGREKTGAKTPMTLLKAIGKESMAVLSVEVHTWFHCRSILTQIVINGQSRAKGCAMRQVLALVLLLALAASVCAQPVLSVQLTWTAPQPVAGANITGSQLARCTLPATATSCTSGQGCMPTPLARAITDANTTTYTDSAAPGLYCYSVLSRGIIGGQSVTSALSMPPLFVAVGAP